MDTCGAVLHDTLPCLWRARPRDGFDTPRVLDEATFAGAFEAWEAAQSSIVERWNHYSDKANLEPSLPRALRDAADVVRSHPPSTMAEREIDRTIDALQTPYTERVTRLVRDALRSADNPSDQSIAVARVVETEGLEPQPPLEPLPEIIAEDVHLVCWMALTAADGIGSP